jgi:urea transport system ATP-binding protein
MIPKLLNLTWVDKTMLKIKKVNQFYGGSHILRDVSFEVPQGTLTVLMGRNGVGKTTMVKTIMGLVSIRSGDIEFNGELLQSLAPYERVSRGIAYVPQGREIFPRLTVEENLLIGAASLKSPKKVPDYIYDIFSVLKDMASRNGGDLSGGQQQQLAIARALMSQPKMIILDEPTEGIQPNIIQQIGTTLVKLVKEQGITILLIEQYLDFIKEVADKYVVMSRGEIVAQGDGANIVSDGVAKLVSV